MLYIACGVLKEYRGQGIGTKLFNEVEKWALENDIIRLDLTVVTENEAAIALYEKLGFEKEGIKRASFYLEGRVLDQYYMGKLLK